MLDLSLHAHRVSLLNKTTFITFDFAPGPGFCRNRKKNNPNNDHILPDIALVEVLPIERIINPNI